MRGLVVAVALLAGVATAQSCTPAPLHPYMRLLTGAAKEFHVPSGVLEAVVMVESSGRATIVNPDTADPPMATTAAQRKLGWTGATLRSSYGLAQLLGITAWRLGAHYGPAKLLKPALNLRLAAKYLHDLYAHYGSWGAVFSAYNGGPLAAEAWLDGRSVNGVYVSRVMEQWKDIKRCEQGS